jgi:geranylgeranyl pyrophosphate synthase
MQRSAAQQILRPLCLAALRAGAEGKRLRSTVLLLMATALSPALPPEAATTTVDDSPASSAPASDRRAQQRLAGAHAWAGSRGQGAAQGACMGAWAACAGFSRPGRLPLPPRPAMARARPVYCTRAPHTRAHPCSPAEITEMIHVASLLHDDVIDDAGTRRGLSAVNTVFGNKVRRWVCSASLVSLVMCVQLHSASPHNNTPALALPLPPLPPCPCRWPSLRATSCWRAPLCLWLRCGTLRSSG